MEFYSILFIYMKVFMWRGLCKRFAFGIYLIKALIVFRMLLYSIGRCLFVKFGGSNCFEKVIEIIVNGQCMLKS